MKWNKSIKKHKIGSNPLSSPSSEDLLEHALHHSIYEKEDAQHNLHVSQDTVHSNYFCSLFADTKTKKSCESTIHKTFFVAGVGPEPTTSGL